MGTACPSQLKLGGGPVQLLSPGNPAFICGSTQESGVCSPPPASFPLSTRGSRVELILSPEICEDAPESGGTVVPSCRNNPFLLPSQPVASCFSHEPLAFAGLGLAVRDGRDKKKTQGSNLWVQLDSSKPARLNMQQVPGWPTQALRKGKMNLSLFSRKSYI